MTFAQTVLAHLKRTDALVLGFDGYVAYDPGSAKGLIPAESLRIIADELDRINAAWHAQVCKDLDVSATQTDGTPTTHPDPTQPG